MAQPSNNKYENAIYRQRARIDSGIMPVLGRYDNNQSDMMRKPGLHICRNVQRYKHVMYLISQRWEKKASEHMRYTRRHNLHENVSSRSCSSSCKRKGYKVLSRKFDGGFYASYFFINLWAWAPSLPVHRARLGETWICFAAYYTYVPLISSRSPIACVHLMRAALSCSAFFYPLIALLFFAGMLSSIFISSPSSLQVLSTVCELLWRLFGGKWNIINPFSCRYHCSNFNIAILFFSNVYAAIMFFSRSTAWRISRPGVWDNIAILAGYGDWRQNFDCWI